MPFSSQRLKLPPRRRRLPQVTAQLGDTQHAVHSVKTQLAADLVADLLTGKIATVRVLHAKSSRRATAGGVPCQECR